MVLRLLQNILRIIDFLFYFSYLTLKNTYNRSDFMCLLGIDIGTSSCKATIIDFEGNIKGQAYKEYSLVTPKSGWQEIDSNVVWSSVKEVIVKSSAQYEGVPIKAVSVSSFGEAA